MIQYDVFSNDQINDHWYTAQDMIDDINDLMLISSSSLSDTGH